MKNKTGIRFLACIICLVMTAGLLPLSSLAYGDYTSKTHVVFKHSEQTLAPGVEYYNNYAYSNDNKQMVYYVAVADIGRDDVVVQSSYKDAQCQTYGMARLTEQMAAANAKYSDPSDPGFISEYYTAVAGTNGDFYNMTNGQPSGAFVMDGVVRSNKANNRPWFAVFEDGTAMCGADNAAWDAAVAAHGAVLHAVGGSQMLVVNHTDVTANASGSYNTDRHSRAMVGVTPDNKVVLAVLDGRQEPFSCGGTMHELAQIMLEADCLSAINLDGGGSATFAARPEGENDVKVVNRPSDGSERSISSGLIIASTAPRSDVFDHATLTPGDDYITPGTSTAINAVGVSPAGTAAPIPADVTYEATLGSVVDGAFVSDGTTGTAHIVMLYNGTAVGSTQVKVVVPDSISFGSDEIQIPYGQSADLGLYATCGLNTVKTKPEDFEFTLSDPAAGTVEGTTFTAASDDSIVTTWITATFAGTDIEATALVTFGAGSEVLYDFESGLNPGFTLTYSGYNYYLPRSNVKIVDSSTGEVHGGNYSLALNMDYSNNQESGYQMTALRQGFMLDGTKYFPGAKSVGAWLYIPDEDVGLWVRWQIVPITAYDSETGHCTTSGSVISSNTLDGGAGGTGVVSTFDGSGWHYLSCDLSAYKGFAIGSYYYLIQFYISDRDGGSYGYYAKDQHNINGDFTIYLDDITVDYSSVIDDREPPVFQSVLLGDKGPHSSDAYAFPDGYVSEGYSELAFSARVAENTAKSNHTGIDPSSAKAYIDGNEVNCTYANGIISAEEYDFADGRHTVKFEICDRQGNKATATRRFTVSADPSRPTVKVVPHDPSLDRILHGSIYWADVVATDVENIQTVTTALNLDSMSKWELDHMEVADGFEASYTVREDDKIAYLTITRTGNVAATGEGTLVSIPIRTWELDNAVKQNPLKNKAWTYAEFKATREFWPVATEIRVQQGKVVFTDGTADCFTGENVFVWSESWANYANMTKTQEGIDYFNAWDGGHIHTEEALEDNPPTCTEPGYVGRTYCPVCGSISNWGDLPANGHSYRYTDGVLKCRECGDLLNGLWTTAVMGSDGKLIYTYYLYADGLPAQGWYGDSYYVGGLPLTGIADADGYYYDFGDDGVCPGRFRYSGLYVENGDNYCIKNGEKVTGWQSIDEEWYFFDLTTGAGLNGSRQIRAFGYTEPGYFEFENGKLLSGLWFEYEQGTKYCYGPGTYFRTWKTIDGEEYYFNMNGYVLKGYQKIPDNPKSVTSPNRWYHFDETTGALLERLTGTGIFDIDGRLVYMEEGVSTYAGLIEIDGDYYYVKADGDLVTDTLYRITKNNDLLPIDDYIFDADGKILNVPGGAHTKNGLVEEDGVIRYYVDGVPTYAGLIKVDGSYYYINSSCTAVTGRLYRITKNNDLLPIDDYYFGANGKMALIKGDLNHDGYVDLKDLALMKKAQTGEVVLEGVSLVNADMNDDGRVNVKDVKCLRLTLAS